MTLPKPSRAILLVDGEHSPSVVESAIENFTKSKFAIVALVFLGGSEKADPDRYPVSLPLLRADDPADALARAVDEFSPDEVIDLSDDPVITQQEREELVAVASSLGVSYSGPGYRFSAPHRPRIASLPTIAVVGTGKRTGKTAVCAELARSIARSGSRPMIVTMGRGGPKDPVYIAPSSIPSDPSVLVELANDGLHAASDYIEDAVFTGLPSIGAWRCGGGLLGETGPNVVADAVRLAEEKAAQTDVELLLLEGSGASIPPVHADVTVTVAPWAGTHGFGEGAVNPFEGLGLYRLLVADAVVTTMCPARIESEQLERRSEVVFRRRPGIPVVHTTFDLVPTKSVHRRRVVLATTAAESSYPELERQLRSVHGAELVGISSNLSRREILKADLDRLLPNADVLMTELKAAAVDVAVREAVSRGLEVVFVENRPRPVSDGRQLEDLAHYLVELANKRFEPVA
jgi:cyclic 2,3-diphosphoglycerate synthetase